MAPPRRQQLAPRRAQLGTQLAVLRERVEHVELERRPREAALLELAGHREHLLRGACDVLARRGASPRVGARAPVLEDASREHEPRLALGAQLLELLVLAVELRLDVRLLAARADHRRVPARAEQQADRLREDRLAGAGLTRDRVQPRREVELGLADEDEVLDAQSSQHRAIVAEPSTR